jgi:hypothetical protein
MENNQTQQQIQIKITDEVLKGTYANTMQVLHTQEEFVIDFMNLFPPNGIVSARVILSPSHVKRMLAALQENIAKYEQAFGKIKEADIPDRKIGFQA